MRTFWVLRDPTQQYEHDLTPLHFCCALNLVPCVRKLLPTSRFPQQSGNWAVGEIPRNRVIGQYLTAVDVASMFGNVEILAILFEEHFTPVSLKSADLNPYPEFLCREFSSTPAALSPLGYSTRAFSTSPAFSTPAFSTPPASSRPVLPPQASVPNDSKPELGIYQPLFIGTRYGQVAAIDYLVGQGCDIFEEDEGEDGDNDDIPVDITKTKRIALEVAIDGKNHAAASALYRHHRKDIARTRRMLERFITSQSRADGRNLERLAYLVRHFPELWVPALEVKTDEGPLKTSILHIAAAAGSLEMFDFLTKLWRKANPSLHHFPLDSRGCHPLHYAAAARQGRTIERIIQIEPDARMRTDSQDRNCPHYAALREYVPDLDAPIQHGNNPSPSLGT